MLAAPAPENPETFARKFVGRQVFRHQQHLHFRRELCDGRTDFHRGGQRFAFRSFRRRDYFSRAEKNQKRVVPLFSVTHHFADGVLELMAGERARYQEFPQQLRVIVQKLTCEVRICAVRSGHHENAPASEKRGSGDDVCGGVRGGISIKHNRAAS